MGELEIPRSDENLEPREEDAQAQRELDDATHEPRTYVEESGDYQQAEDIQNTLTEVVENLGVDAEDEGATPLPIPRPEEQGLVGGQSEVRSDLDEAETGEASKGRDAATPINLPGPQPAETPEPGSDPFPQPLDTPGDTLDQVGDYTESGEPSPPPVEGLTLEGTELLNESGEPLVPLDESMLVNEHGEFIVGAEIGLDAEGMEGTPGTEPIGEGDQEVPEEENEGGEGTGETPDWYIHEDKDGNVTVVDADGNAVNAAPKIIYQNGKYYAAYPGDSGFVEDGSVPDTSKLTELTNYKGSAEGMYVHDDGDGNLTVVDKEGNAVNAPPKIIYYGGKYYAVFPGDEGFDEKGGTAFSTKNLTELTNYKGSAEGMYVHDDGDGNLTVVDADGNAVNAAPKIIYYGGKYYAAYPGDEGFVEKGGTAFSTKNLTELTNYKGSAEGMYVHDDGDGNLTVVDKEGNAVNAPPKIIYYGGKYYAAYPGDEGFVEKGGTAFSTKNLTELTNYKGSAGGMYVHDDGDGNLTVVDADGNAVNAAPKTIYQNGKYYAAYPGDSGFVEDGSVPDTSKLTELPNYKGSAEGMYVHDDGDGNLTVVDENGKKVKAPPKIIEINGKYYAAYPGDEGFDEKGGTAISYKNLTELPNYKPSWWKFKY